MNVIICLDDKNGMLFNNRRQTRDSAVICDIFDFLKDEKLYITPFSEKLFSDCNGSVEVCTQISSGNGWFFCENTDLSEFGAEIKKLLVYRWNRVYPADTFCTLDFGGFSLCDEKTISGHSHPEVKRQFFVRG